MVLGDTQVYRMIHGDEVWQHCDGKHDKLDVLHLDGGVHSIFRAASKAQLEGG